MRGGTAIIALNVAEGTGALLGDGWTRVECSDGRAVFAAFWDAAEPEPEEEQ